jgi:hypothetical protein
MPTTPTIMTAPPSKLERSMRATSAAEPIGMVEPTGRGGPGQGGFVAGCELASVTSTSTAIRNRDPRGRRGASLATGGAEQRTRGASRGTRTARRRRRATSQGIGTEPRGKGRVSRQMGAASRGTGRASRGTRAAPRGRGRASLRVRTVALPTRGDARRTRGRALVVRRASIGSLHRTPTSSSGIPTKT